MSQRKEIDREDVGNGERLVWYSLDGLTAKESLKADVSRHAIVHEHAEGSETLCMGAISHWCAYHYFAGTATGFAIARNLRSSYPAMVDQDAADDV